jgi:hypothetical protein
MGQSFNGLHSGERASTKVRSEITITSDRRFAGATGVDFAMDGRRELGFTSRSMPGRRLQWLY